MSLLGRKDKVTHGVEAMKMNRREFMGQERGQGRLALARGRMVPVAFIRISSADLYGWDCGRLLFVQFLYHLLMAARADAVGQHGAGPIRCLSGRGAQVSAFYCA